jgi:peptidoglycan/xylan/chitin deacetylase (PgdA/CDA1 family)
LVRQLDALGVEWLAHGESATRMMHAGMSVPAQRTLITSSVATVLEATGRRPAGWLSQDWGTTPDTFALLAEAGLRYTLDWTNDDAPFALRTNPPLVAVPLSAEFDDVQCQWMRHLTPHDHAAAVRTGFLRLRDEARAMATEAGTGKAPDPAADAAISPVFGLALHPWLSGMSSRIGALRTLLADLARTDGVHWTTPGRIAADAGTSAVHARP